MPGFEMSPVNSVVKKLRKTTKGKGRHFLTAKEGAGMTAAGRAAYNKETGGNLKAPQPGGGKRRTSYCARSKGQMKMHNINCSKKSSGTALISNSIAISFSFIIKEHRIFFTR